MSNKPTTHVSKYSKKSQGGAAIIEYAILVAVIAVGLLVVLGQTRDAVEGGFQEVNTAIEGAKE